MDLLDSMRVYVLAVEKGSLSAAAAAGGMSATMAGNHLRMLEKRLGTQLLARTTRRQHLTDFGADYYARCKEILRLVTETDAQAHSRQLAPAGKLRVTAPVTFGTEALMPALSDYFERHAEVRIDVTLNDRVVNLVDEGFEVAIRIGALPDSGLIAKPLAPYRLMMCASPQYLASKGTPAVPDDLRRHECLSFSPAALTHWRMADREGAYRVAVSGRLKVDHGQALRVAALHGLGVVLQPAILLEGDVRAGRLVQVLPGYELPARPMSVVFLPDPYRSLKLRSFVDFLVEQFG
jgi:DNA-binding transcriptional LysR family regulator